MKPATREQLRALHTAGIVAELEAFLGEVYALKAPEPLEVPEWDPPNDDKCDVVGKYEFEAFDLDDNSFRPSVGRLEGEDARVEAAYYRERYRNALELCYLLRKLAQELHTKLDELGEVRSDHVEVVEGLSDRAKRLREDLGL